jgi:uncharacterized repeat protein (TIGR03803 family)
MWVPEERLKPKTKVKGWFSELARTVPFALLSTALLLPLRARSEIGVGTLFSFQGTNGAWPISLIQGIDGNLYGTTSEGGANGKGTIFQFTLDGAFTCLASFDGTNGSGPRGLLQWTNGDLYGTTWDGGSNNLGTIFRLTPGGAVTNLFSFDGTNGTYPFCGLVPGPDGNFYGTAQQGGANPGPYSSGLGTVFRVTPGGAFTLLLSFNGTNGGYPHNLLLGTDGDFYGASSPYGNDTIFRMTASGDVTNVFTFNATNGLTCPYGLFQGADDTFYGATDGAVSGSTDTIFSLTTNGTFTTLFSFSGTNGSLPRRPVQGPDGNLYGVTGTGGASGTGTLFKLAPDGSLITLMDFNGTNGASPFGGLVLAKDGRLYGTTMQGGLSNNGTIFRVSLAPAFLSVSQIAGSIQMTWNAMVGQKYQVQSSTNLLQTNWDSLGDAFTATNASATVTDTILPAPAQRFYRILTPP